MHTQLVQFSNLVQCMDSELYEYLRSRSCTNMFFCFRWLLIHFKREFPFNSVMQLWEVFWSNYYTRHYHMFFSLAILVRHRNDIMKANMEFDDILKFVNNLSMGMDASEYLGYAELLYINFTKNKDPAALALQEYLQS